MFANRLLIALISELFNLLNINLKYELFNNSYEIVTE